MFLPRFPDHRFIERLVPAFLLLADENPEQDRILRQLHGRPPAW